MYSERSAAYLDRMARSILKYTACTRARVGYTYTYVSIRYLKMAPFLFRPRNQNKQAREYPLEKHGDYKFENYSHNL